MTLCIFHGFGVKLTIRKIKKNSEFKINAYCRKMPSSTSLDKNSTLKHDVCCTLPRIILNSPEVFFIVFIKLR